MKRHIFLFILFSCFVTFGFPALQTAHADHRAAAPAPGGEKEDTLKSEPAVPAEPAEATPPRTNYEDVPDEYLDEAQRFGEYCKNEINLRQWHDCECMAVKYLDQRIKLGPKAHNSTIILSLEEACPDATEATGVRYQQCIGNALLMTTDIPIEDYCTCYANTFGRLYEAGSFEPGSGTSIRLQTQAMVECNDVDNPAYQEKIPR